MTNLSARLCNLVKLEKELVRKAAPIVKPGAPMYVVEWFALGAAQRTLAQSRGFRSMIETKNFPCAAILLRTQIDTAMRINGIRYLENPEEQLFEVFSGRKTFRNLSSLQKTEKGKSMLMHDSRLMEWLSLDEPWIGKVYEETSDFVHLSFRPLLASVQNIDDTERQINFAITGGDNSRAESDYYEICDAFFNVSKLTCTLLLALLTVLHAPEASEDGQSDT